MTSRKKILGILVAAGAVFALSGCGSNDHYYRDNATTLFLVDESGIPYGQIPYTCYEGNLLTYTGRTLSNGEFTFYPGEDCKFDFYGLDGVYDDEFDDIVRIVDAWDGPQEGKGDIPYECEYFNVGSINYTYSDGSFYYDEDDACVFYL